MSIDARLPEELPHWLSSQRWYASKGSEPQLERIGGWSVVSGGATLTTHYLLDHLGGRTALYQVPLSSREVALDGLAIIGTVTGDDGSPLFVSDATGDPAYAAMMLGMMLSEETLEQSNHRLVHASTAEMTAAPPHEVDTVTGHRQPGAPEIRITGAKVLSGEQSNTSIICDVESGPSVIIKVFRALHHGENPDVTLQSAIAAAGSHRVPTSIGSLEGSWSDTGRPGGTAIGHLAFAQEFLPGVQDAWRVALRSAETGGDFAEQARDLGKATAEVHAILAAVMPTREVTSADIADTLFSMQSRLAAALAEVPALEPWRSAINDIFSAAAAVPWPTLQRIHGDYHLGQVLSVPGQGWVLLDFEGEPLRPMAERSELDLTLRDVAGMLRSFDYAAGSVALAQNGRSADDWAADARAAFIDGYVSVSGTDLSGHSALLDALEIDKALYEAVYEARNRPDWLEIPATAIRRLAGGSMPNAG